MFVKYILYIFLEKGLEENITVTHSGEWDGDRVFFLIILVF